MSPEAILPRPDGLYQDSDYSRADGTFELFGVTGPRRLWAALQVHAEGFMPATAVFKHDTAAHLALITLVRRRP
jgi:hypothetical protein